jgi:hypothetical protein
MAGGNGALLIAAVNTNGSGTIDAGGITVVTREDHVLPLYQVGLGNAEMAPPPKTKKAKKKGSDAARGKFPPCLFLVAIGVRQKNLGRFFWNASDFRRAVRNWSNWNHGIISVHAWRCLSCAGFNSRCERRPCTTTCFVSSMFVRIVLVSIVLVSIVLVSIVFVRCVLVSIVFVRCVLVSSVLVSSVFVRIVLVNTLVNCNQPIARWWREADSVASEPERIGPVIFQDDQGLGARPEYHNRANTNRRQRVLAAETLDFYDDGRAQRLVNHVNQLERTAVRQQRHATKEAANGATYFPAHQRGSEAGGALEWASTEPSMIEAQQRENQRLRACCGRLLKLSAINVFDDLRA